VSSAAADLQAAETGNINFQVLYQSMQKRTFSMQMKVCVLPPASNTIFHWKRWDMHRRKKNRKNGWLFCCAAMLRWGEKLKPLIIGNAARPGAFKINNVNLDDHVIWRYIRRHGWHQRYFLNGWMRNQKIKQANRKILLFGDNATSHVDLNLSNIA
jgi:hypothetical protein